MKPLISIAAAAILIVTMAGAGPVPAAELDTEDEGFSAYSVARLKVFEGTAWVRTPDSGEWEEYSTNTPVPERARVNIPEGSEAELQFHGGQYVLLRGGTEVDVRKFDEQGTTFRLRSGEIRFDLPADDFSPVKVAVPGGGKVDALAPGRYWVNIENDGQARLVVREGEGRVTLDKGEYSVKAGEQAAIGQDVKVGAFVGKADDRPQAPPPPLTEQETQADVPPSAAYELRDYGDWVYSGQYGWAWQPRVATGWTPYYYGRWVWVSPYGWTWVSNEPWGWYPYHYGWWVTDPAFGWIWCPFNSFVSVSFVFGHHSFHHHHRCEFFPSTARFVRDGRVVRWDPLRPGEHYRRPVYTRSDARLGRWDKPLTRGTVYVRGTTGTAGKREWRDWTVDRSGRAGTLDRNRTVIVRETPRGGGTTVRGGSTDRPGSPTVAPGRQQRVAPGRGKPGAAAPPGRTAPSTPTRIERERPAGTAPYSRTPPSAPREVRPPQGYGGPRESPGIRSGDEGRSFGGTREGIERGGGGRPDVDFSGRGGERGGSGGGGRR